MGCYDFFNGTCPKCGKPFEAQTKLLSECFDHYSTGSPIALPDMRLRVKERCDCGLQPVIVIQNGKIVGLEETNATHSEGYYGSLHDGDLLRDDLPSPFGPSICTIEGPHAFIEEKLCN